MTTTALVGGTALADLGAGPELVGDVTVVLEDDQIAHLGGSWTGTPDRTIDTHGRLLLPGLVNLHAHAGHGAHHHLVDGAGEPDLLGATYLTAKAPAPGSSSPGSDPDLLAEWTVWELLRTGTTTVLEAGCPPPLARALVRAADRVGLRVHVGVAMASGRWIAEGEGIAWEDGEDAASQLALAEGFLDEIGTSGLTKGAVAVAQVDTASDDLLAGAAKLATARGVPLTIHAAQNRREVLVTLEQHAVTPLERLHRAGALAPGTVLAHAVFADHHPAVCSGHRELALLAESGAAVAHCPVHLSRRGDAMHSFDRYVDAGVVVGLGTDTSPRDLLAEARAAATIARTLDGGAAGATARIVGAITTESARALGRPELGRLAVGGPADLVVVDERRPSYGVVSDPVRAAVECATGDDVEHVFVAGRHVVRGGTVIGLDGAELRHRVQTDAEALWATAGSWHRRGLDFERLNPPPFPPRPQERS
ncbi:MAG: amidohydrolase family protein [Acidimicrobiales bacterium]